MEIEQGGDDAADQLVRGVQRLVRSAGEELQGRVGGFEREEVVEGQLRGGDDAEALGEVEVVYILSHVEISPLPPVQNKVLATFPIQSIK